MESIVFDYFDYRANTIDLAETQSSYDMSTSFADVPDALMSAVSMDVLAENSERALGFDNYLEASNVDVIEIRVISSVFNTVSESDSAIVGTVYEWTAFDWVQPVSQELIHSGFGTEHTLTFQKTGNAVILVADEYDESDITGMNTVTSALAWNDTLPEEEEQQEEALAAAAPTSYAKFTPSNITSYASKYVGPYNNSSTTNYDNSYYNRMFINCQPYGGDCANFASQCLYDAGLSTFSEWDYDDNGTPCTNSSHKATEYHACTADDKPTSGWRAAINLYDVLSGHYYNSHGAANSNTSFSVGDLLFRGTVGTFTHVYICSQVSGGQALFSAHTDDRQNVPFPPNDKNNLVRLHLHNVTFVNYNATQHRIVCASGDMTVLENHIWYGRWDPTTMQTVVTCVSCGAVRR